MTALNLLATICIVGLTIATQAQAESGTGTALNSVGMAPKSNVLISLVINRNNAVGNLDRSLRYQIIPSQETWADSYQECKKRSMELVKLLNPSDLVTFKKFMKDNYAYDKYYWIYSCKNMGDFVCSGSFPQVMMDKRGQLTSRAGNRMTRNPLICKEV